MPNGAIELTSEQMRGVQSLEQPDESQLQAVLGPQGVETYQWWATGRERALSVASIRRRSGTRKGTGFLRRRLRSHLKRSIRHSGSLRLQSFGVRRSIGRRYDPAVAAHAWTSEIPIASGLPPLSTTTYVYIIGHPSGGDLTFSFRGKELLAHEGPPNGNPQIPGLCRVHYRATTEVGSAGSPVFNAGFWELIALHHSGSKTGMSMLNGKAGILRSQRRNFDSVDC